MNHLTIFTDLMDLEISISKRGKISAIRTIGE